MSSAQTSRLNAKQLNAVIACFLGWTLDAFDFFIMIFVVRDVAKEFGTDITAVTYGSGSRSLCDRLALSCSD